MLFLELILRVAGITVLLMISGLILRDGRHIRPARFGAILAVGLAAVLATSISEDSFAPPQTLRYVLSPLSASSAIFIWWYCLALFDDDFRLGPLEWSVAALWTALGVVNWGAFIELGPVRHEWATIARTVMATGLVAHIVYVALRGRQTDLIERRRRARLFVAFAISILFLTDLIGERFYGFYDTPLIINIFQISLFLAVILWSAFWLLRFDGSVLAFEKRPAAAAPEKPALGARERQMHEKLIAAMVDEKAYLDPALSIGALAARIGAPEHQLRALINKSMGHRNFRSFVNGYRMDEAKNALHDPEKAALPILTIAMDSGFASLASFNRAFKQATGATPSEFRNGAFTPRPPAQN